MRALAVNLVVTAGWTWVFFARRRRGAPLTPYPLWCAFATLLSTRIWMLNH